MTISFYSILCRLTKLLFPTLILACYLVPENVCILELEISCKLLVSFLQEALAREEIKGVVTDAGGQQGRWNSFIRICSAFFV